MNKMDAFEKHGMMHCSVHKVEPCIVQKEHLEKSESVVGDAIFFNLHVDVMVVRCHIKSKNNSHSRDDCR